MPYNGKTDWKLNEMVYPEDMNRIEGQIEKNTSEIEGVSGKIGNPSDNEDQLTLFGKLAALLKKVMGIDDKVGTSSDADTQPTLFGKIAGIGDTLSENLTPVTEKITEVLNKVTGIDGKIGTSVDTSGTLTLFGQVKSISEKMPTGSVKSIQRGTVWYSKKEDTKKISISRVNPEKCFVILNVTGDINSSSAGRFVTGSIVQSLTETELTIYTMGYNINNLSMTISWQVIECF